MLREAILAITEKAFLGTVGHYCKSHSNGLALDVTANFTSLGMILSKGRNASGGDL